LKLRLEVDGQDYTLDVRPNDAGSEYALAGALNASGSASILEVMPDVFSVLLGRQSFTVHITHQGEELELWVGGERHTISIADARDRSTTTKNTASAGAMEIRSQMPGKVIKLLAAVGAIVEVGQGVIVVEAMKMQNEMKSPKHGTVSKILVREGTTVGAGETLVVVE
jgi:biotin carboxyl carrier protein